MWQRSSTGMYHNGGCNGVIRNRPLFLEGEKKSIKELREMQKGNNLVSKYYQIRICKKCNNGSDL